jgi:isopentenyl-diphosphate delta-isomerase
LSNEKLSREYEEVELVDDTGRPAGSATVDEAHRAPGQLHRAFSVLLLDPAGRLLLQQRAAVKTRFPLRWANACCGHPRPGDAVTTAGARRLAEEIGIRAVPLTEIGVYVYRATDPVTGRVEHEYDHVLLGRIEADHPVHPDPAEVAALRWVTLGELSAALANDPETYAPWLAGVVGRLTLPNGAGPSLPDAPRVGSVPLVPPAPSSPGVSPAAPLPGVSPTAASSPGMSPAASDSSGARERSGGG